MPDLEILVPVLNEEKSVTPLVKRLHAALKSAKIEYKLLFIDDHSSDGTLKKVKALKGKYPVSCITKKGNPGKAYSILEGAKKTKAPILAMLDGDLQYPPEAIPAMFGLMHDHGIVVANRTKNSAPLYRKIISKFAAFTVGKIFMGFNCDAQSGLKVFKREILEQLSEEDVKPWALDMPLLYAAKEMGETIGTVDIDFSERKTGRSKVNTLKTAREIALVALKLRFGERRITSTPPNKGHLAQGSGVVHKSKKYITHTQLPHRKSALYTLVPWQKWFIVSVIAMLLIGLIFNALATVVFLVSILSLIYFADVIFSGVVLLKSLHFPPELAFRSSEIDSLADKNLPVYTVLCPLYKEGAVLPRFVESMKEIDWPKNKLEVLILLEEDDEETYRVAKSLRLPRYVKIIVVPDSQPRTKPKACNYGLTIAKGEFTVVYDAEDRPDRDQLKKAFLGFRKSSEKIVCLQSKLNYYNPDGNLLTRLFTAEYSLWFDVILPGLQSIESSIPLGGTSNHFRTKSLVDLHGWDPFNVTEDCDLGVRIFKSGYKTAIIDSTTLEEANSSVKNWIRQRSRWIKGYIQTYLVHMRDPIAFFKEHGIHAVIFQLIIGMRISFMFINPFLWLMTLSYFAFRSTLGPIIESLYPPAIFYIASFALVAGNFMYIYNYMIGCAKRGHYGLIKYVFFVPLYWLLSSRAALKAIHQLIVKPHFWEKTHHGLDQAAKPSLALGVSLKHIFKTFTVTKIKAASSGVSLVAAVALSNFLNFVTSAYLGRVLAPEEFGLIALMGSFLFLTQLGYGGIFSTMSHQTAFLSGRHSKVIGNLWGRIRPRILMASVLLFAVWVLLIPFLPEFFHSETTIPFLVFAPMWIILMLTAVDSGFIQGTGKYHMLALIFSTEAVAKLILTVIFVKLGITEWVYAALPLSTCLNFIVGSQIAKRLAARSELPKRKISSQNIELRLPKKFFAASILSQLSIISFLGLDLFFVKHFMTPRQAGIYALLALSGKMVFLVGGLSTQFINPIISRQRGSGSESRNAFIYSILGVAIPSGIMFIAVGVLGSITLPVIFGQRASEIVIYSFTFSLAMLLFSVASGMVAYHQAKRNYIFVFAGISTAAVQALLLSLFHENLSQIVGVMLISSIVFLVSALVFHLYPNRFSILASNFTDFLDLVVTRLNGKKPVEGKLRILVFNWRDTKHVWAGGAEVYVHEIVRRWVEQGHKVTIFCGNDGKNKRNEEIDGVNIVRRGGFYTVYLWAFFYYVFRFRGKYDVVVDSENGVPFFTPLYSRIPKILIIYHVHQDIFRKHLSFPLSVFARFLEGKLVPFVYRNVQIVTISNSSKKALLKLGISSNKEVYVVNPGADLKLLKVGRKAVNPTISYLGRLKPYKSVDTLIKAAALLVKKTPNLVVKIAGVGESGPFLEKLVAKLGLSKNVKFLGKITERQKAKLLAESWVFVQPSTMEGWGISVIEANACGTPVVASRVPGLVDSVNSSHTGFTVAAKSEVAFARGIKRLLEETELREQFSAKSLEWSKNFNWAEKSQEFMAIVERTIDVDKRQAFSFEVEGGQI